MFSLRSKELGTAGVQAWGSLFNINRMRQDSSYQVRGRFLANSNHDEVSAPVSLMGNTGWA